MKIESGGYVAKLAETEAERLGAQRLRYRVFVEEMGAEAGPDQRAARLEWDAFDAHFDHLVLLGPRTEDPLDQVVGAYRVMPGSVALNGPGFYGAREFDLSPLANFARETVELGRSCVAPGHRGGTAMHLLWTGLAQYVLDRDIALLFGTASFPGVDPAPLAEPLGWLHHNHAAPPELRVRARDPGRVDMNLIPPEALDAGRALRAIPPLVKAYLRQGAVVGDGAWIDRPFNTIDICLLMDTEAMKAERRRFYERRRSPAA